MRQAGIIAAPGIVALGRMVERLSEDHKNARRLAEGIARVPGLSIDMNTVHTNIVYFDIDSGKITAEQLKKRLEEKGIMALPTGPTRFRMVTHYGVEANDIDLTVSALNDIMKKVA
jgi:threonine aldolase